MGTDSVFPDQKTYCCYCSSDHSSQLCTNRAADWKFTQNFKGPRIAKAMSLLPLERRLPRPSVCLSGRLAALTQEHSCSDGTPDPTAQPSGLASLACRLRQAVPRACLRTGTVCHLLVSVLLIFMGRSKWHVSHRDWDYERDRTTGWQLREKAGTSRVGLRPHGEAQEVGSAARGGPSALFATVRW